jgi:hypothetical protein
VFVTVRFAGGSTTFAEFSEGQTRPHGEAATTNEPCMIESKIVIKTKSSAPLGIGTPPQVPDVAGGL